VPQVVPSATKVRSVQVGLPEPHSRVAVAAHGLVDAQVASGVQATQTPPGVQTWFVPQLVPPATKEVPVQTATPVEHWIAPAVAHGFVGVQSSP